MPFLNEVIDYIGRQLKTPLPPIDFAQKDLDVFASFQMGTVATLEGVMETAASQARDRALLSVGGLPFLQLAETLAERFAMSIPRAVTLASTSMATFYRVATDRAFQVIEKDLPQMVQRYRYYGPDDLVTRPFCRRLVESDRSYTRAQIDEMSNGMLPNVWITGGGWNCRHQWIVDTQAILAMAQAA